MAVTRLLCVRTVCSRQFVRTTPVLASEMWWVHADQAGGAMWLEIEQRQGLEQCDAVLPPEFSKRTTANATSHCTATSFIRAAQSLLRS
jgi:hypothetical protein